MRGLTDTLPSERTLTSIWHHGLLASELRTTDGRSLRVIFRGLWTHSDGPDFRDAMLDLDGQLVRCSVELHVRASDWLRHNHQSNPAYDAVGLHAVHINDLSQPIISTSGTPIPTVEMSAFYTVPLNHLANPPELAVPGVGMGACLPTLPAEHPEAIIQTLERQGWQRLVDKSKDFSQSLTVMPAGEVLYRGIAEALGYSRNREPMIETARRAPLIMLERIAKEGGGSDATAALLFAGGFIPLSGAGSAALEADPGWASHLNERGELLGGRLGIEPVSPESWSLNRVRPANHPARRLASLADLVNRTSDIGLVSTVIDALEGRDGGLASIFFSVSPAIGEQRTRQIVTNILAPFLAAYADSMLDERLAEQVGEWWDGLPGRVDDQVSRRTLRQIVGDRRFPIRSALAEQGLHHISRNGCELLRCFECPIAQLAAEFELPRRLQLAGNPDADVGLGGVPSDVSGGDGQRH